MLQVKVIPNASKNEFVGFEGEILKVRIKGVPEKGKVNEELILFLAKNLKIAKSQIAIVRGATSRLKVLKIEGVDDLRAHLAHLF